MVIVVIIILLIAIILFIIISIFFIISTFYKVILLERHENKWRAIIVNKFGAKIEWFFSDNSDYGKKAKNGTFSVGSKFNKWFLRKGNKDFTFIENDKKLN